MSKARQDLIAPVGLVVGAVLGLAGTFVPSASLRGLAWGLDGISLIVASALLTVHYFRRGNDLVAAGFLVFMVGETPVVSGAAMDLVMSAPAFGAGVGLWAASLAVISATGLCLLLPEAPGLSQQSYSRSWRYRSLRGPR